MLQPAFEQLLEHVSGWALSPVGRSPEACCLISCVCCDKYNPAPLPKSTSKSTSAPRTIFGENGDLPFLSPPEGGGVSESLTFEKVVALAEFAFLLKEGVGSVTEIESSGFFASGVEVELDDRSLLNR